MIDHLTVLTFESKDVPDIDGFREYISEVSSSFCPYIEPSMAKNSTMYTIVHSETNEKAVAEKIIFGSGYAFSELLRRKRACSISEQRVPLLCDNVLFIFPHINEALDKELLSWPHWILKCRYTQLGILFGKFWKNAQEKSKDGRDLPIPPCNFISIRESIRAKDPRFFDHADWLRPALESSNDSGQNVFHDMEGYPNIIQAMDVFCDEPSQLNFEGILDILILSNFYSQAKQLATQELERHKLHKTN